MFSYARVRGRVAALLAVGVTATTISAIAPAAWAADVLAPRLDSITFTSPADVRPGDPVTISYAVTDASPTVSVVASFLDGSQRRTEWDFGRDLPLGGSASTTVPDGIANTTAHLYEVTVTDAAGNRATYGQSGVVCVPDCPYVAVPLSHSLVVTGSTPDTAAPVLTSVAVPSATVAVGQVARLDIDVDDANPPVGPEESAVQAVFTNGAQLFALSADPTDRRAAVGVVPPTVPNGTYWLSYVVLRDLAGNVSMYRESGSVRLSPAGTSGPTTHTLPFAATTITVTGSTADYTPPVLTSVGSPQKYFVAGSTGTVSYTATEEFLESVTVRYSAYWIPEGAPGSWDLVATPTTAGLASGPVPTGTANSWYVSSVVLRDKAGNWSEYDRAGHLTCNRSCPSSHNLDLAMLDRTVVTVPTAPSWTGATGLNGSARVQWNTPDFDGWSAVTGYVVTVSPGGRTYTVAAGARSVTVPGLANDAAYSFSVRARNAAGLGPARAAKATPRAQRRLFLSVDVSNDGRADLIGVTRGNVAYIYRGNGTGGISGGTRVGGQPRGPPHPAAGPRPAERRLLRRQPARRHLLRLRRGLVGLQRQPAHARELDLPLEVQRLSSGGHARRLQRQHPFRRADDRGQRRHVPVGEQGLDPLLQPEEGR